MKSPHLLVLLLALTLVSCAENNGDPFNTNVQTRLPIVVSDPADGAAAVDVRKVLTVSFTSSVDPRTLLDENLVLQTAERAVARSRVVDKSFTFDADRREVSIFPREPLAPNTAFQLIVQGIRTLDDLLYETTTIDFITGTVNQPPTVSGQLRDPQGRVRPLADAANVDIRSAIELTFSRSMEPASVTSAFSISPRVVGTFSLEQSNTRLVFTHPTNPFPLGQRFTVMVSTLARDASDQRLTLAQNFVAQFTTPQVGLFRVVATDPPQQTPPAAAFADTPVQITFGEAVDRSSALASITFEPASASPVVTFASNDQVVIISHAVIPAGTPVTVTVGSELLNTVGVELGQATGGRDFVLEYVIESTPPALADPTPTVPANDARNVAPDTTITFNFNERLDPATVSTTSFTVTRGGTAVPGTVALSPSGQSVIFTPATTFQADPSPVVATATTGIRDLGGTALATDVSISFFIDDTGPGLAFTDPPNGATEVPVDRFSTQPIVADFTEPVDQASTRRGFSIAPSRATDRTGANGAVTFASATRLLYTTNAILLGNTQYTVRIAAQDLAGNPSASPLTFAFTTDATAPLINTGTLAPAPGSAGQPRQPLVFMEFTERMDQNSVRLAFSLSSQGQTFGVTSGSFLFGEVGAQPARTTLTYQLNPGVLLPANAVVNINLDTRATDLGLNALTTPFLSTFTTGP